MSNSLVSVIIPVYNVENYVKEAIQSIQNQTYSNLDIIVIDDGSSDKTYTIVEELAKDDNRIKLYKNEKNLKIVKTLNRALSLANGEYIARMDGDDISAPDRIEKKTYESIKYFIDNYSQDETSKMYVVGPYKNMQNNHEFSNEYVNNCFELIKNNKLENRVIFTDRVSKEETQNIFKKSKALLFFSDKEGMPNVVLEAMANNCVPITSEMDGVIREIFEDKKQGFILDDSFEKIDNSFIDEFIENRVSYLHVRDRFGIDVIAGKYRGFYVNN